MTETVNKSSFFYYLKNKIIFENIVAYIYTCLFKINKANNIQVKGKNECVVKIV